MIIDTNAPATPVVAAPASKRNAILAYRLSNPGASAKQITDALGVNLQYVYMVLKEERLGPKVKRKLGRPRKVGSPLAVPVVKRDPELDNLRRSVSEHAHIVDGLKKEIEELTVIIAYLEHRCAKAEGSRGPAI